MLFIDDQLQFKFVVYCCIGRIGRCASQVTLTMVIVAIAGVSVVVVEAMAGALVVVASVAIVTLLLG
jgi:hypothetical protein